MDRQVVLAVLALDLDPVVQDVVDHHHLHQDMDHMEECMDHLMEVMDMEDLIISNWINQIEINSFFTLNRLSPYIIKIKCI